MKIKPNYSLTKLHAAGEESRKVFLIAPKVYPAKWATNQPNWANEQKVFATVDGVDFLLLGSEYQIEGISKREHAQKNRAKHLDALALLWHCHVEWGKPPGWVAEFKPTVTRGNSAAMECIGAWLYRKLALIERRAHRAAENLCNVTDYQDKCDWILENGTADVAALFGGKLPAGFTINRDPRGYALKLEAGPLRRHGATPAEIPDNLHRDWGGDFILAPSNFA